MLPHIVPLGSFCFSASLLKRHGNRSCAYPFDWSFISLASVVTLVRNNLADLLDENKLTFSVGANGQRLTGHRDYGPNLFYHHDLSIDNTFSAFQRRSQRLITSLQSGSKFLCTVNYSEYGPTVFAQLRQLAAVLREKSALNELTAVTLMPGFENDMISTYTSDEFRLILVYSNHVRPGDGNYITDGLRLYSSCLEEDLVRTIGII